MLDIENIKNIFNLKKCELLSTSCPTRRSKLQYIASCGHMSSITFSSFISGRKTNYSCPKCSVMTYEMLSNWMGENKMKLLTSKSEYAGITGSKLKYIASCGHEHTSMFWDIKRSTFMCPNCSEKNRIEDLKNQDNIKFSKNNEKEQVSIQMITDMLHNFDVIQTKESCPFDLAVRPKSSYQGLWIPIQVKSCTKGRRYLFTKKRDYKNMLILCICLTDKRMWLFDGNMELPNVHISIGLTKSKHDIYEVNESQLVTSLEDKYETYELITTDMINIPISPEKDIEYSHLDIIKKIDIPINMFIQNRPTDFTINDKKVQLKSSNSYDTIKRYYSFSLNKRKTSRKVPYEEGDNDFYWFSYYNIYDELYYFYLIPESRLISEKYIKTQLDKGKQSIRLDPYNSHINQWATEYIFSYEKIVLSDFLNIFK